MQHKVNEDFLEECIKEEAQNKTKSLVSSGSNKLKKWQSMMSRI